MRILLVSAPSARVRGLTARLQDPDLDVILCGSAREALDYLRPTSPDLVVLDDSLPRPDVVHLYGRLRASVVGSNVPILFTNHDESSVDLARTTAPDFYSGPDASLEEIEQLIFTFLPDALFDQELGAGTSPSRPQPSSGRAVAARAPSPVPSALPERPSAPASPVGSPAWFEISGQLQTGPAKAMLAYLGVYALAELLGTLLDARLGLLVHAGLLLAIVFHGANVPTGPERAVFWTLWLAPLTRIYALAQPFAGAPPLSWWALTTIPMAVAGIVAMRLAGLTPRDAGLIPSMRQVPLAVVMAPVGLALGLTMHLLLAPRPVGQELPFGGIFLVALIAIVNPGIVDEVVFRGVLQRGVAGLFGPVLGVLFTSLFYASVAPAGLFERGSVTAVLVTFVVGVLLATLTMKSGSVLASTVAHASLALGLFVLGPLVVPHAPGISVGAPGVAATPEVRLPTPKPAIIVVSPPAQPSPSAQPPQPGQLPPGAPTPITLAPPLSPPQSAPSGVQPATGGIPAGGQAAVVRGTGGSGARLRMQPGNSGTIITVVPENTPLLVIGADRQADGLVWRNVRVPNGNEGWIAAEFVSTGQ